MAKDKRIVLPKVLTKSFMLRVGDQTPDFIGSIQKNGGGQIRLSDFIGQRVALYFYPKGSAYGCNEQACSIRNDWKTIKEAGIVVIGVSGGRGKSHQKFAEKTIFHFLLYPTQKRKSWTFMAFGEE
ncbi:MAG: redoxin domain-containing protein [Bacteroidetes bacterium]|nr:redoxin domain-containing protein [Bacteroidota bacterium]